jgi:hypothetical protein
MLFCFSAVAEPNGITNDPEYKQMVERLNQRYQDYFIHEKDARRFETQREKGVAEVKKERTQEEKLQEKARLAYIQARRKTPDPTPNRLKWEGDQRREAKAAEREREAYVQKKSRISRLEKTARQIPVEVESGLIPNY